MPRRQKRNYLVVQPSCDVQCSGCLRFIWFPGRIQVTEDDGVRCQVGGLPHQRSERGIERTALSSQFLQVVDLAEGDVVKGKKSFGGLLRRLLAVKYGGRRLPLPPGFQLRSDLCAR
jgi:hypothetical protein